MSERPTHADAPRPRAIKDETLAVFLLLGGLLQLVANVVLNGVSATALRQALTPGVFAHLLALAPIPLGFWLTWTFRRRRVVAGIALLCGFAPLLSGLLKVTPLGIIYYTEYVLFHFNALVAAALCLSLALGWRQIPQNNNAVLRFIAPFLASSGVALLLYDHTFLSTDSGDSTNTMVIRGIGNSALIITWTLGLLGQWHHLKPVRIRTVALLVLGTVLLRIALAGPQGIVGASVANGRIIVLGTALTLVPIASAYLIRPQLPSWARVLVTLLSLFSCAMLYLLYLQVFGNFEGDQFRLLHSIFGFHLPYPQYVDSWKSAAFVTGVFFILVTLYGATISSRDRAFGLALTIVVVAGIGMGSSHLVLMLVGGGLYLVDRLRRASESSAEAHFFSEGQSEDDGDSPSTFANTGNTSFEQLHHTIVEFAQQNQLPDPLELEDGKTQRLVLRGLVQQGTHLDLRISQKNGQLGATLQFGLESRERAKVQLLPSKRPKASQTHLASGDTRLLEQSKGQLESALSAFPSSKLEIWDAGVHVDFGPALTSFDADSLGRLLQACHPFVSAD